MKTGKLFLIFGLFAGLAMLSHGGVANAAPQNAPIVVTTTSDDLDVSPGDGTCESVKGNGVCTLRGAIMEANKRPGADVIQLGTGDYKITLLGSDDKGKAGDFDIKGELVIHGNGTDKTTVDGDFKDRVFDMQKNSKVELHDLRIYHGSISGQDGGGIRARGASLDLFNVNFDTNFAEQGGGISHSGSNLYLEDVTMRFNHAAVSGGAIFNDGPLFVVSSTLDTNYAEMGAGLFNEHSALVLNSTVFRNHAKNQGGGIVNALEPVGSPNPATLDLSNVTVTANVADDDPNSAAGGGGIYNFPDAQASLRNTIVAKNLTNMAGTPQESKSHDCYGAYYSYGYNLIRNAYDCTGFQNGVNGDQVGNQVSQIDPGLASLLANNGGPTQTIALLPNSPAIDKGNPLGCNSPYGHPLFADQRGYLRQVDGLSGRKRCDIGALEYGSSPLPDCSTTKPMTPELLTPAPNAQLATQTPNLDWIDIYCANKYKVTVRQNAMNGPKAFKKAVTLSQVTSDPLAKGHDYYWSVKACGDAGCTKSNWYKFTVKP